MKKILTIAFAACALYGIAQNTTGRTCGTPVLPQQYENWVQSLTKPAAGTPGKYGTSTTQSIFNIPVIVHVIHNNETLNSASATSGGNLNAAQIQDQINILNKDFNGLNADTNLIPSAFKPALGKFQINFCLAVVNPTGGILAEPGIDRINRVAKGWNALPYNQSYINSTVKPNSIWDPNKYLNMWVLDLGSGLLGYATFPNPGTSGLSGISGATGTSTNDGVVILNTSFGSIGTAQFGSYNKGRTATHEIGHWLGLRHIWGDGNCATDYCNDTPPAQAANYGCPSHPYKLGTCTGNTTGEMTMNFMDYTDDACMYMFTMDQKNRAQLILTNSSIRAALITSTVCNLPSVGNDVGISFVAKPTYSQTINCTNTISPVVNVTNFGSTTLNSALFTFNIDGGTTQTQSWTGTVSPNNSFTVALPTLTVGTTGAHVFSVNVSAPNGGSDNNPMNNNNVQNFFISNNMTLTVGNVQTCQGNPVTITANGATTYSWSTGANTATVSVNPTANTIYTVTGTAGGCVQTKTVSATVQTAPTLTINRTSVCYGALTTLTAQGASTYVWQSSTGNLNGSTMAVTLISPKTYSLVGATTAGCSSTLVTTIQVDPLPVNTIVATHVTCGGCSDATVSVSSSGASQPYSYLWNPGGGTTAQLDNVAEGCYTVQVTDANGCKATESACVLFDVGIRENDAQQDALVLMPNPTKSAFEIKFGYSTARSIEIVDALGRVIKTAGTSAVSINVDLAKYADGIYYVKIISGDRTETRKIVKQQ